MNTQYKSINILYNSQFIGGSRTDMLYVLTRNAEIDDCYGKHQQGYIFIDETPKEEVLKNIQYSTPPKKKAIIEKMNLFFFQVR